MVSKTHLEDKMKLGSKFTLSRRAFLQTSLGAGAASRFAQGLLASRYHIWLEKIA